LYDDTTELNKVLLPAQRCAFPAEFLEMLSQAQRHEAAASAAQTASDVLADDEIAHHHATNDEIAEANVRRARRSSIRIRELQAAAEHLEALEESIEEDEEEDAAAAAAELWGMVSPDGEDSPAGEDSCDTEAVGAPEAEAEGGAAGASEAGGAGGGTDGGEVRPRRKSRVVAL
jgi:hypothetical protein